MSLDIVRKNSNSPFQLQRSIVDQGGAGGAYESGGFNPDAVYNNDAANAAVESLGKVVGAAISSRTAADNNASDVKTKERLDKREKSIKDNSWKNLDNDNTAKRERAQRKLDRIDKRQERVESRITDYNKTINPFAASASITRASTNTKSTAVSSKEPENKSSFNIGGQLKTNYSDNSNLKAPKKENINGPQENAGPLFWDYKKAQKEDLGNKLKFFGK
jgi:hypothetical protein